MTLRLKRITAKADGEYEVLFEELPDRDFVVTCRVGTKDGIRYANVDPDIFMQGRVDARKVVAAVWAFHEARHLA